MTRASDKKITERCVARARGFLKTRFCNAMNLRVNLQNLLRYCFCLDRFSLDCFSLDRLDDALHMEVARPEGFIKGWIKL